MTEQSSNSGRDQWGRDGYVSGEQYYGEQGGSGYRSSSQGGSGYGSSGQGGYGSSGQGGYGSSGQGGYGSSGQGGSGYGSSGQGGSGYEQGATRPVPSAPAQGTPGQGTPGQGTPLWQAAPGQGAQGQGAQGQPGYGTPPPAGAQQQAAQPMNPMPTVKSADQKGFFESLFDFSFTSFVTTRIIKVLYVLILIMTGLGALIFTISAFNANALFGLLTLIIGDPLFIIIVMAFWRLVLESFVVVFRIAEDVHAMRERGEQR